MWLMSWASFGSRLYPNLFAAFTTFSLTASVMRGSFRSARDTVAWEMPRCSPMSRIVQWEGRMAVNVAMSTPATASFMQLVHENRMHKIRRFLYNREFRHLHCLDPCQL